MLLEQHRVLLEQCRVLLEQRRVRSGGSSGTTNVMRDWQEPPISQFSRYNFITKYTPSSLLGRGILDCHYVVIVLHPTGALIEFIRPNSFIVRQRYGLDRSVSTIKIHIPSPRNLAKINLGSSREEIWQPAPYHTPRSSEQKGRTKKIQEQARVALEPLAATRSALSNLIKESSF